MSAGLRGPVDRLSASTWLGLGLLGLVVFFLGVYIPAWKAIPALYSVYVQVALAVAGGCLATLGFSYYADRQSKRYRPRPPSAPAPGAAPGWSSSFEVYSPRKPRGPGGKDR